MSEKTPNTSNQTWNYKITKFFLENTRLTILAFVMLVALGLFTGLSLKTTGFPSPEIGIVGVITVYPGASSETVNKDITIPLEGAIRNVEGIDTYSSVSRNSLSSVTITLNQGVNVDSVNNKIDSAIRSVNLPVGVETPKIIKPDIGGPEYIFTIAGKNNEDTYRAYDMVRKDLTQMPETSKIEPFVDLKKQVVVVIDSKKLQDSRLSLDQIQAQLKTIGESLPIISDTALNQQSYTLVTTINGDGIEAIKNLQFTPAAAVGSSQGASNLNPITPKKISLTDVAEVSVKYNFEDKDVPISGLRSNDKSLSYKGVIFSLKSAKGTDQSKFNTAIADKFKSYKNIQYITAKEVGTKDIESDRVLILENYNVNYQNQDQVGEVIGGLIGSPLKFIDGPAANLGWLLGGIQLVFLVMLAFVSWRAAIIAAISIPLSLVFSTIYLYFIGESLNTLVLFSLVLVIGLVVDPALVILEAIQRKIDTGLKGKDAVLSAIKDVGNGLFLATLTNIIIFMPFALISGILGKIFAYIPLTVIPATIGSYVVPLIFLAWLGGLILKPSKNKTSNEEENLWPIAKWVVALNTRILNSHPLIRTAIIALLLIASFGTAAYYSSTGKVKQVTFASSDDTNDLQISGSFLPLIPKSERENITKEVVEIVTANKNVNQVFPIQPGFNYFIELKESQQREEKSNTISKDLEKQVLDKFGNKFFDFKLESGQTGPPTASYQVSIAVKTDDLQKLEETSREVGKNMEKICLKDTKIIIDSTCSGGNLIVEKIDNGYTDKENKVLEILIDRQKLQDKQLTVPNAPLGILVNQKIKQLFNLADGKKVATITVDTEDTEVILDKKEADPTTINEISNLSIYNTSGQEIKLADVAQIKEKSPKSSIQRVDGQTQGNVQARLKDGYTDQGNSTLVTNALVEYYKTGDGKKFREDNSLNQEQIAQYSEGNTAANTKSFQDLITALLLAIFLTYLVLSLFFQSFTQPLVILYTIPLTFIGLFPGLAYLGGGQIGFLEIIGIIILIGIVENVAIFLIDAARQKINDENWDEKRAISFASGVRLRPVIMTKFTAIASLAPLAVLSQFYRSISVVIIFGLLSSGFISLITTPILFIFFKWLSRSYRKLRWYNKILFFPLFPIYIIVMALRKNKN